MTFSVTFIVFGLLLGPKCFATDYFVDCDDGLASNDGLSEQTPFDTLQKAVNVVNPGDVILVMNGTCGGNTLNQYNTVATITRSGTASQMITMKNYPGHSPQIGDLPAQSSHNYGILTYNGASHWRFEGLNFRGTRYTCLRLDNLDNAENFEVINNTFDQCGKGETDGTNQSGHVAIYTGRFTQNTLTEGNTISNSGRVYDPNCDALGSSLCHQYRHDHGMYMKGKGHVIRNNVFWENNMGYGVKIDGHNFPNDLTGTTLSDEFSHIIVNNTFGPNNCLSTVSSGRCGNPITVFKNGAHTGYPRYLIANNVFIEPSIGGLDKSAVLIHTGTSSSNSPWDNYCLNNITIGTTAVATCADYAPTYAANITISGNVLNATEAQVALVGAPINGPTSVLGDYRIQAGSSAINFGAVLYGAQTIPSVPSDDYDDNNRDQAGNTVDAGAFEL
jgi:hypothetical protein